MGDPFRPIDPNGIERQVAEMLCTHVLSWPCSKCLIKATEIVDTVRLFDGYEHSAPDGSEVFGNDGGEHG